MEISRKIFQLFKDYWILMVLLVWNYASKPLEQYFPEYLFPLSAFWVGVWLILNFIYIFKGIQIIKENTLLEYFKKLFYLNVFFCLFFAAIQILAYFLVMIAIIVPVSVAAVFPLILVAGVLLYLIGLGFHFVEKSTNK